MNKYKVLVKNDRIMHLTPCSIDKYLKNIWKKNTETKLLKHYNQILYINNIHRMYTIYKLDKSILYNTIEIQKIIVKNVEKILKKNYIPYMIGQFKKRDHIYLFFLNIEKEFYHFSYNNYKNIVFTDEINDYEVSNIKDKYLNITIPYGLSEYRIYEMYNPIKLFQYD